MRTATKFGTIFLALAAVCLAADDTPATIALPATSSSPGTVYVATLQNGFSIRFDHRAQKNEQSRLFLTKDEASYVEIANIQIAGLAEEKLPEPSPVEVRKAPQMDIPTAVAAASDKHGIDADLLYSVIRAESGFNPRAVSNKGAQGLMQLMPDTANKLGVHDAFDTEANVEAGTRYLRELLDRYHYDVAKALAAYNAGPQRVEQYHGVPPYRETRAYVARIIREYNQKKLAQMKLAAAHRGRSPTSN
jgi:soluble lytic murein transglycosylase-like protein